MKQLLRLLILTSILILHVQLRRDIPAIDDDSDQYEDTFKAPFTLWRKGLNRAPSEPRWESFDKLGMEKSSSDQQKKSPKVDRTYAKRESPAEQLARWVENWVEPSKYEEQEDDLAAEEGGTGENLVPEQQPEAAKNDTGLFKKVKNDFKKVFSSKKEENSEALEESDVFQEEDYEDPAASFLSGADSNPKAGLSSTTVAPSTTTHKSILGHEKFSDSDVLFLKQLLDCIKTHEAAPKTPQATTQRISSVSPPKGAIQNLTEHVSAPKRNQTTTKPPQKTNSTTTLCQQCQQKCKMSAGNVTVAPSVHNSKESNGNTSTRSVSSEDSMWNRLKYMAHVHHPVETVGKPVSKPVDLKEVQKQLDSIKHNDPLLEVLNNDDGPCNSTDSQATNQTSDASPGLYAPLDFLNTLDTNPNPLGPDRVHQKRSARDEIDEILASNHAGGAYYDLDEMSDDDRNAIYDDLDYFDSPRDRRKRIRKSRRKKARGEEPTDDDLLQILGEAAPASSRGLAVSESSLNDLVQIQSRITPEQEMDIHRFLNALDERPQPFHFDVSDYIREPSVLEEFNVENSDDAQTTPRAYFQFNLPPSPLDGSTMQKRDIGLKMAAVQNLFRPNVGNDLNSIGDSEYRRRLMKDEIVQSAPRVEDPNRFVDQYYLLNDGQTNLDDFLPSRKKVTGENSDGKPINMVDLNIDLELEKEFQDLQFERERTLKGESNREAYDELLARNGSSGAARRDTMGAVR